MADKRRRARVQGGWSSQNQPQQQSKSVATSSLSEANKTASYNVRKTGSNAVKLQQPADTSQFEYQPSQEVKKAPPEIIVTQDGSFDISKGVNGTSSLELCTNFIAKDEATWMFGQLFHEIPWGQKEVMIKGEMCIQPRLTAWFGDFSYTYSGLTLKPFQWSPLLNVLRDKIRQKTGICFNSMLANLYRDCKDSVDWHSDDESTLGPRPVIASLSFGQTRNFELRQKSTEDDYTYVQKIKIPLPSGSLLIMKGSTQTDWQHRVPKEYHDKSSRINLTFRTINPT